MELDISKTLFLQHVSLDPIQTLLTMGESRMLLCLAIGQVFAKFMALWNFNMAVNRET